MENCGRASSKWIYTGNDLVLAYCDECSEAIGQAIEQALSGESIHVTPQAKPEPVRVSPGPFVYRARQTV